MPKDRGKERGKKGVTGLLLGLLEIEGQHQICKSSFPCVSVFLLCRYSKDIINCNLLVCKVLYLSYEIYQQNATLLRGKLKDSDFKMKTFICLTY